MTTVAILTPEPEGPYGQSRWRDVYARLERALGHAGVQARPVSWTSDEDLSGEPLILPLCAWGYHHVPEVWLGQLDRWEAAGAKLQNPLSVLRWNFDKSYLGKLAERGAPVVPTIYADRVDETAIAEAADRFGTDRLVAKPTVSGGAHQTLRWSPGASLEGGPEGAAMVQPYLPTIEEAGEVSLFFFGGWFSHAVRKVPKAGDFRVQPEFDGEITVHRPTPDETAAALAVLRAVEEPLLYARVDLVRDLDGRPALIELELIEPDLYLAYAPDEGAAFGRAVAETISAA